MAVPRKGGGAVPDAVGVVQLSWPRIGVELCRGGGEQIRVATLGGDEPQPGVVGRDVAAAGRRLSALAEEIPQRLGSRGVPQGGAWRAVEHPQRVGGGCVLLEHAVEVRAAEAEAETPARRTGRRGSRIHGRVVVLT